MKSLKLAVLDSPPDLAIKITDVLEDPSTKFLEIDATRLRGRVPAEGLVIPVSLDADIDGRSVPLTLMVTIKSE